MKPQRGKTPSRRPPAPQPTDPVEVFCRVRPLSNRNDDVCVRVLDTKVLQLTPPENSQTFKNGQYKQSQYTFEYVFDEFTSQKALYDHVALPLVEDVLRGKNALLFAYGITSSGKTHTMTGVPQDQGVLPRCLDVIFNSLGDLQAKKYVFKPDRMNGFDVQTEADAMVERQRRDIMPKLSTPRTPGRQNGDKFDFGNMPRIRDPTRVEEVEEDNNYAVFVSYSEIYNNYIYDLLEDLPYDPITGYRPPQSKILREDAGHNMYVSGVVEVEVKTTEEAYDLLWKGQKRRKIAHTALNTESSRSHSVFNIRVVQGPLDPLGEEVTQDKEKICVSQLSLVDLAGSERTGRTQSAGDRLKEAGNINQSLMVLRTCIEYLRENQKTGGNKMVPFRDSRLTHLFKNYFEGQGKVRMVVCVNPKAEEYDETLQVMRFAELTQEVMIARPQQVRFDTGYTPGRRRMNQQYRQAIARAVEEGVNPEEVPIPAPLLYSLGPTFPLMKMNDPEDHGILIPLAEFLKTRDIKRQTLISDLQSKEDRFREQLVSMEKENVSLREKVAELTSQLESHGGKMQKIERKMKCLERDNNTLQKTAAQYAADRRDLHTEIEQRDLEIRMQKNDKDRIKQDYQAKLMLSQQQWNQKLYRERAKFAQESQSQILAKEQKLNLLKNIINSETSDSDGPRTLPRPARTQTAQANIQPARSEPDLSSSSSTSVRTRARTINAMTPGGRHTAARINKIPRAKSPPALKPKPVVNPRYHRRSKSSNADIWLEHKPSEIVDTGTLMQPNMKKKRSVTNLKVKDTKEASKYALTTQEQDSNGDIETKIFKGDVLPTAGGGASVVFNDVETLKQTSPGDRKRRAPHLRPEDFDGEWTDTEDRCKTAIEHHGKLKKVPKTSLV